MLLHTASYFLLLGPEDLLNKNEASPPDKMLLFSASHVLSEVGLCLCGCGRLLVSLKKQNKEFFNG